MRNVLVASVVVAVALVASGCGGTLPYYASVPAPESTLRGVVANGATDTLIAGAEVVVGMTGYRATTDGEGIFEVRGLPWGQYELVAHRPGFESTSWSVTIDRPQTHTHVALYPGERNEQAASASSFPGPAGTPSGSDVELVTRLWLGTADAGECRLLNPEALIVRTGADDGVVRAYSDGALHVENRRLGFDLRVFLLDSRITVFRGRHSLAHRSVTGMEAIAPKGDEERGRWRENRIASYRGSMRHFLAASARGRAEREGFQVFVDSHADTGSSQAFRFERSVVSSPIRAAFLIDELLPGRFALNPSVNMAVQHESGLGGRDADIHEAGDLRPTSYVSAGNAPLVFDASGRRLSGDMGAVTGYWKVRAICDLLPYDYVPDWM